MKNSIFFLSTLLISLLSGIVITAVIVLLEPSMVSNAYSDIGVPNFDINIFTIFLTLFSPGFIFGVSVGYAFKNRLNILKSKIWKTSLLLGALTLISPVFLIFGYVLPSAGFLALPFVFVLTLILNRSYSLLLKIEDYINILLISFFCSSIVFDKWSSYQLIAITIFVICFNICIFLSIQIKSRYKLLFGLILLISTPLLSELTITNSKHLSQERSRQLLNEAIEDGDNEEYLKLINDTNVVALFKHYHGKMGHQLKIATINNNEFVIKHLLQTKNVDITVLKGENSNPLFHVNTLNTARILVNAGLPLNDADDFLGKTPILKQRDSEIIKFFIQNGADVNHVMSRYEDRVPHNLLTLVIEEKNNELISFLVRNGADINRKIYLSQEGVRDEDIYKGNSYPLSYSPDAERTELLLNLGAKTPADLDFSNMLKRNDFQSIKLLIDHGMSANASPWGNNANVFMATTNVEILKYFIEKGADVNLGTPLTYQVEQENLAGIELLLNAGANINQPTSTGETALDYCENEEIKKMLINKGAKKGLNKIKSTNK